MKVWRGRGLACSGMVGWNGGVWGGEEGGEWEEGGV